jgi:hypothetical protein
MVSKSTANKPKPNIDRGVMSVPRSFPPDQYNFLTKILAYMLRLGGSVRGENQQRAVRYSEAHVLGGKETIIKEGSVATRELADGSVTTAKIAGNAVTGEKIAQGAVTERELRAGSVGRVALSISAVVASVSGEALDGDVVTIPGNWFSIPCVGISAIMTIGLKENGFVGVTNLRESEEAGVWQFDAVGSFHWFAIGYPAASAEEGDEPDVEG